MIDKDHTEHIITCPVCNQKHRIHLPVKSKGYRLECRCGSMSWHPKKLIVKS